MDFRVENLLNISYLDGGLEAFFSRVRFVNLEETSKSVMYNK